MGDAKVTSSLAEIVQAISEGVTSGLKNANLSDEQIAAAMQQVAVSSVSSLSSISLSTENYQEIFSALQTGFSEGLSELKMDAAVLDQAMAAVSSGSLSGLESLADAPELASLKSSLESLLSSSGVTVSGEGSLSNQISGGGSTSIQGLINSLEGSLAGSNTAEPTPTPSPTPGGTTSSNTTAPFDPLSVFTQQQWDILKATDPSITAEKASQLSQSEIATLKTLADMLLSM